MSIGNIQSGNQQTSGHEEMMQILKRYLHQNNLSLYCFQNQNNQTLLDVIADYLSLKRQQLHSIIVSKFRQMLQQEILPKRLVYVYNDSEIVKDYQKDPDLVSFFKITYELVCAIYEVRLVIFSLVEKSDKNFLLNAMIINPKKSQVTIQLARLQNAFYRVQQQFHPHEQFSLASLQSLHSAISSSNLNSEQKEEKEFTKMRQPFKSQQIIVDLDQNDERIHQNQNKPSPEHGSQNGEGIHKQYPFSVTKLKQNKSANFHDVDFIKNQSMVSEYGDDVSLGSILDREEEKDLLRNCTIVGKEGTNHVPQPSSGQRVNLIHQNNHMATANMIHSPDMMYYYYLQQGTYGVQGYPGKSQPYLPYAGHSISPTKNPNKVGAGNINTSPMKSSQPYSPVYPSQQSQDTIAVQAQPPTVTLPPIEIKEGERYKGKLKFFDEGKNYGFIIMEADQSDLFVHFDDLHKAGITKEKLKNFKQNQGNMQVKFSFKVMEYFGKYRQSRKAVELQVMEN